MQRVSFDSTVVTEASERWDAALWGSVGGLRTLPQSENFRAEATLGLAGAVHLYALAMTQSEIIKGREQAQNSDDNLLKIAFQKSGKSVFRQGGNDVLLERGGWIFYDTSKPYSIVNLTEVEHLVAVIPRDEIRAGNDSIRYTMGRDMTPGGGISALAPDQIAGFIREFPQLDGKSRIEFADIIAAMVRLAISEEAQNRDLTSSSETLRSRVETYVRRNSSNPNLTVDGIAARFSVTKRHLHRVFAEGPMTLDRFIWSSRIERSAALLREPEIRGRPLTAIAFDSGFNSSAHFSKAFRDRFDMTPSEYRERYALALNDDS